MMWEDPETGWIIEDGKSIGYKNPFSNIGKLFYIGVSPLDLDFFKEVESILDSENNEKSTQKKEKNTLMKLFKKKGVESFFAYKESDKDVKIWKAEVHALIGLYSYLYDINKKYKDNKNYSAEEMCFLYFSERVINVFKSYIHSWEMPKKFELDLFLETLPKEIFYLVTYLKDLGFNSEPKNFTFKEVMLKHTDTKNFILEIDKELENKSVHEYLTKKINELKKELRSMERKEEVTEKD